MRLTPAQVAMSLMIRGSLPMMKYDSIAEGIARGRQDLVTITGKDFGYDLKAWHDHLVETDAGGYKSSSGHRSYPKQIKAALKRDDWHDAVKIADAELNRIEARDNRRRIAIKEADREWAGRVRPCPKCNNEFKSVADRGQCTNCSYVFYASHPEVGNTMWWLEID